ncbi:gamma-glutamylcyclotransferase [Variovorax sp. S2]|jgi:gamma-glutamylcyclotransferase|uniref:gamma-glutamylcyclotransferase family protein n=1 Tax=Variovorax sp. S12S4 TaxID=3029170 RepID=UPI00215BF95F|nr:gamma-glutamylcyclotransferase family protein [Variovorax sp. S12S4]MCR8960617.1 gamma-glutamylcyclotransferase [Variovorax sp. S12S4]
MNELDHSAVLTYFAYGSNMSTHRLQGRVPSARAMGIARLAGHQLRWHKISKKDGSGKCDVIVSDAFDASVYGVLYEIKALEKSALDRFEGLGFGYQEKSVEVDLQGKIVQALTYFATNTDASLVPWTWYRAHVVAGAREHGLPTAYIEALEAVAAEIDPDHERHHQETAIHDRRR